MDVQLASLREQVQKEKATSRDNLKKVMKLTQEKKTLEELLASTGSGGSSTSEAEVAALRAQAEQLQQQLSAKTVEAEELEEELEGAKEEVEACPTSDPTPAPKAHAVTSAPDRLSTSTHTRAPGRRCSTGRMRPRRRLRRPGASRRAPPRSDSWGISRA